MCATIIYAVFYTMKNLIGISIKVIGNRAFQCTIYLKVTSVRENILRSNISMFRHTRETIVRSCYKRGKPLQILHRIT